VEVECWIEGEKKLVKKIKFRLHDKLAALDKLARHLGMFKETNGSGSAGGNIDRELLREFARLSMERQRQVKVIDI
jgi:hypothetical protein